MRVPETALSDQVSHWDIVAAVIRIIVIIIDPEPKGFISRGDVSEIPFEDNIAVAIGIDHLANVRRREISDQMSGPAVRFADRRVASIGGTLVAARVEGTLGNPAKVTLVDAKGKAVKQMAGESGEGGIGGGDFALAKDLPAGEYTLRITQAGDNPRMLPQERRVEILRDLPPQFQFDRDQYFAGQNGKATFMSRVPAGGGGLGKPQNLEIKAGPGVSIAGKPPGAPVKRRNGGPSDWSNHAASAGRSTSRALTRSSKTGPGSGSAATHTPSELVSTVVG